MSLADHALYQVDFSLGAHDKTPPTKYHNESVHRLTEIRSMGIFYLAYAHATLCFFHINYNIRRVLIPKGHTHRHKTETIVHINGFTYHKVIQQFFSKVLPPKIIISVTNHPFIIKAYSFCCTFAHVLKYGIVKNRTITCRQRLLHIPFIKILHKRLHILRARNLWAGLKQSYSKNQAYKEKFFHLHFLLI